MSFISAPNLLKRFKELLARITVRAEEGTAVAASTQIVLTGQAFGATDTVRLWLGGIYQHAGGLTFTPPATIAWGEALPATMPYRVEINGAPGAIIPSAPPETRPRFNRVEKDFIGTQLVGQRVPVASATSAAGSTYVIEQNVDEDGYLKRWSHRADAPGTVNLKMFAVSGGDRVFQREVQVAVVAGLNEFTYPETLPYLEAKAGERVALYTPTAGAVVRTNNVGNYTPYVSVAGNNVTSFTPGAAATVNRIESGFFFAKAEEKITNLKGAHDRIALLEDKETTLRRIGTAGAPVAGTVNAGDLTFFFRYSTRDAGRLDRLEFHAAKEGTIYVGLAVENGADLDYVSDIAVHVEAGANDLAFPAQLAKLAVPGSNYQFFVYGPGIIQFNAVADNLLTTRNNSRAGRFTAGSFTPGAQNTTAEYQVAFTVRHYKVVDDRASDDTLHLVVTANSSVKAYTYSGGGYWLETAFDYANDGVKKFTGWRTVSMWKCIKSSSNKFQRVFPVTAVGSSELDHAIQVQGAAGDAFCGGGVHGFDIQSASVFVLDGQLIDTSVTAQYVGHVLEQRHTGALYPNGDDTTNPANKLCDYVKSIRRDRVSLDTEFAATFLRAKTLTNAYIGMVSMGRTEAVYGQVTDRASRPPAWPLQDLTGVWTGDSGQHARRTVWGQASKVRADVEAVAGFTDPSRDSRIEVNVGGGTGNHKVYMNFGINLAVINGTAVTWATRTKITTG